MRIKRGLKFNNYQREELTRIGLADTQIQWLQQALPAIAHEAEPGPPHRAVRDELAGLHDHFAAAALWFGSADSTPARNVAASAMGRVAHRVDKVTASGIDAEDSDALPRRIDAAALSRLLLEVCKTAMREYPLAFQKSRRPSLPPSAVGMIVAALWRASEPTRNCEDDILELHNRGDWQGLGLTAAAMKDVLRIIMGTIGLEEDKADSAWRAYRGAQMRRREGG